MSPAKKLIVTYFSPTNRFYKARLEDKHQVISLSQEETTRLIGSTAWTTTESKPIHDNKRMLIKKTYVLALKA